MLLLMWLGLAGGGELHAQTSTSQEIQVQNNMGLASNSASAIRTFNFSTIGLKGSPLLLPGWVPGEITLQSGRQVKTGLFNYDVFVRQVTVKRSPTDSIRYKSETVKQLILRPEGAATPIRYEHVPDLITDEADLKTELLRIIHQGTYSLVQLPIRKFVKAPVKQSYDGLNELNNEYRDESVYYLIRPDHTAEKVKLTRKSLVRALKEKGAAFEDYLKKNDGIDLANEAQVANALATLN
jgi:hypothetical protein